MKLEQIASCVLALSAVAVAVTVVHREFGPTPDPYAGARASLRPEFVKDWRELGVAGIRTGDASSRIEIVEFADFECPFCKVYEPSLQRIEAHYPSAVHRVFVHFPLTMHPHAQVAARASECANDQGRFAQMRDALYTKQDSIGVRSWSAYGADAKIGDVPRFEACVRSASAVPRIDQGSALAKKLKLGGTPTLIVNGWRFNGAPPDSILIQTIDDLLAGKRPRASKS
jgi:protein-disulfide isomerase